jgi:hypothetical protein
MSIRFTIFQNYPIENDTEFEILLSSIEKEQALFFLIEAVKHANNNNVYSMSETELISRCVRKLYSPNKPNETINNKKRDE